MHRVDIQKTFPAPGVGPAGLAWDGATLWHADYRDGQIYGLDPTTSTIRYSLYCPGNLSGLTWDGRALWQSLFDQEMVRCVNPETNDFDQTIILEGQGWISGVAWDGRSLWIVAQQYGKLLSIDLATNETRPPLTVPIAMGDIDYRGGYLWASVALSMRFDPVLEQFEWLEGSAEYAILQIDPAAGGVIARFKADQLYSGLCWVGENLWLANSGSQSLYRAKLTSQ